MQTLVQNVTDTCWAFRKVKRDGITQGFVCACMCVFWCRYVCVCFTFYLQVNTFISCFPYKKSC